MDCDAAKSFDGRVGEPWERHFWERKLVAAAEEYAKARKEAYGPMDKDRFIEANRRFYDAADALLATAREWSER